MEMGNIFIVLSKGKGKAIALQVSTGLRVPGY